MHGLINTLWVPVPLALGISSDEPIDTPERAGVVSAYPVAQGVHLYAGTMAALNGTGYVVPAADTSGLVAFGRIEEDADNSDGQDGDITVRVKRGCFKWANSALSAVGVADINTVIYVEDDHTVAHSNSNGVKAGLAIELDDDGVWVDSTYHLPVVGTVGAGAITAAKLAAAVAQMIVGSATVTVANTGTPDGVAHVTVQAKDAQGNNIAARVPVTVFLSGTSYGAPTALGTLNQTLVAGTLVKIDTADAIFRAITDATGLLSFTHALTEDGDLYVMAQLAGICAVGNAAITGNA